MLIFNDNGGFDLNCENEFKLFKSASFPASSFLFKSACYFNKNFIYFSNICVVVYQVKN